MVDVDFSDDLDFQNNIKGCIIFELIAGRGPFRKRGEKVKRDEVEARVKNEKENYSKEFTASYARELAEKEFIEIIRIFKFLPMAHGFPCWNLKHIFIGISRKKF